MVAAEQEFMERGFTAAKMTAIAKRAGVTHAMLHYYYRNKENLFDQVFQQKMSLMAQSFLTVVDQEISPQERIRKAIEFHFDFLADNPRLPLFILREIVDNPERRVSCQKVLMPVFQKVIRSMMTLLNREAERGTIAKVDAFDFIMSFVSLNIFTVLSLPVVSMLVDIKEGKTEAFLRLRKEQIVQQALDRLRCRAPEDNHQPIIS